MGYSGGDRPRRANLGACGPAKPQENVPKEFDVGYVTPRCLSYSALVTAAEHARRKLPQEVMMFGSCVNGTTTKCKAPVSRSHDAVRAG